MRTDFNPGKYFERRLGFKQPPDLAYARVRRKMSFAAEQPLDKRFTVALSIARSGSSSNTL
jgi:hypothetical protein